MTRFLTRWIVAVAAALAGSAPAFAQVGPGAAQNGSISGTTSAYCSVYQATGGTIQVAGTWVGTLVFEASTDGATWTAVLVTPVPSGSAVTTASANGVWSFSNLGFVASGAAPFGVRVRASAWTSGTATTACTTYGTNMVYAPNGWTTTGATFGAPVLIADGSASVPGLAFSTQLNTGFYKPGSGLLGFSSNSSTGWLSGNGVFRLGSAQTFGWSSNTDPTQAITDTTLTRAAAGTITLTGTTPMIQLGGTTSSFAALKRTGTVIEARLADDSAYTSFNASVITATSNLTNNAGQITAGGGTGITVADGGSVRRLVYKATIDSTAFQCAALTCDVTAATLPAKAVILGAYADMTTAFACASTCTTSTLTASLGDSTGAQGVLLNWDADAAITTKGLADADMGASLARATATQAGKLYSFSSTTAIFVRLTSGTGNIGTGAATNLSQGSITVYLITERLP